MIMWSYGFNNSNSFFCVFVLPIIFNHIFFFIHLLWSGVESWRLQIGVESWLNIWIEVYFNLQWVPLCSAVPEVAQSHVDNSNSFIVFLSLNTYYFQPYFFFNHLLYSKMWLKLGLGMTPKFHSTKILHVLFLICQ
jgi:hypothetical protein